MGVGGQCHDLAALSLGKTWYPYIGGWVGHRAGLDRCGSPHCMVDVSKPQISEHVVYALYVQPFGGGPCHEATILFLREVPSILIVSWALTRSLACHCIKH
jgi:hypothetical protein